MKLKVKTGIINKKPTRKSSYVFTRNQAYYARKKEEDPNFMKSRAKLQRKRYAENAEYREYQKVYHKAYSTINKAEITELHKLYPDKTRNERVKKHWTRESEKLSDKYIIKLLKRRNKDLKITQKLIKERRKKVIEFRKKKNAKNK